ncbi:MAG: hypothetical protein H7831_00445 [Magnetococcus sp. WYHC-3]
MVRVVTLGMMLAVMLGAGVAQAASLPADWGQWTAVSTPLTQIGALPGCDADVSSLPEIYQETVATYCNVKPGGPGAVAVLVSATAAEPFKARNGKFPEGAQMALHLKDLKVLFVTTYQGGQPVYQVFGEDGKDITAASGALAADTCNTCHTGYQAFCVNGQCGSAK